MHPSESVFFYCSLANHIHLKYYFILILHDCLIFTCTSTQIQFFQKHVCLNSLYNFMYLFYRLLIFTARIFSYLTIREPHHTDIDTRYVAPSWNSLNYNKIKSQIVVYFHKTTNRMFHGDTCAFSSDYNPPNILLAWDCNLHNQISSMLNRRKTQNYISKIFKSDF